MIYHSDYSLRRHNTFGLDVRCADFFVYENRDELLQLHRRGVFSGEWLPVGEGSNLLLMSDLQYPVVQSGIKTLAVESETDEEVVLRAGAGVVWDEFVLHCVSNGWGGVENLSFIPGLVGASPVQNIGAYGVEAKDVIADVEVFDTCKGEIFFLRNDECQFEYRGSVFKRNKQWLVVSVAYRLEKKNHTFRLDYGNVLERMAGKSVTLQNVRDTIVEIRREKLPLPAEIGSAGSFFKNPVVSTERFEALRAVYPDVPHYVLEQGVKIPAAWLISQCGWKGKRLGSAGVYEKQPLILVNLGGATGADILQLMRNIQDDVRKRFGISLEPEVCLVK